MKQNELRTGSQRKLDDVEFLLLKTMILLIVVRLKMVVLSTYTWKYILDFSSCAGLHSWLCSADKTGLSTWPLWIATLDGGDMVLSPNWLVLVRNRDMPLQSEVQKQKLCPARPFRNHSRNIIKNSRLTL